MEQNAPASVRVLVLSMKKFIRRRSILPPCNHPFCGHFWRLEGGSVVSRFFRTFGLAERRPALAYAVTRRTDTPARYISISASSTELSRRR